MTMAVLSRRSFGTIELLRVDLNPNGSISALDGSLAVVSSTGAVYKNTGGTAWSQVISNTSTGGAPGAQGAQGPAGFAGFAGQRGVQGSSGIQGSSGSPGAQGDFSAGFDGPQGGAGSAGSSGATGAQGDQGSQGPQGNDGSFSPPEEMKGDSGAQGAQGSNGQPGPSGAQGLDGPQGAQGTQGSSLQGQQGEAGAAGPTGAQGNSGAGAVGSTGSAGPQGAQGSAGSKGLTGPTGSAGSGAQGAQGSSGATGIAGSQGAQGTAGSSSGSALVLVASNIVSAAATTTVTFSGLNGDVDKIYLLKARFQRPSGNALTNYAYYLKPNDTFPASMTTIYTTAGYGPGAGGLSSPVYAGTLSGTSTPGNNGTSFSGLDTNDDFAVHEAWIYAEKTRARLIINTNFRHFIDTTGASGRGAGQYTITLTSQMSRWADTSTNLTSLVIQADRSNGIDIGSEFYLYKLTNT